MQQICYHCMNQTESGSFCPRCGHKVGDATAAAPYHLVPGTKLANRYLVGNVLGEGGFGITYIGLDTTLAKRVAIKEFYPSGAANRTNTVSDGVIVTQGKQEFFKKGVDRFMLEAKSVASFSAEDGIVDVLDYFLANGTAYIVMEYLEGDNLKDYINKHGVFSSGELIGLMLPVMKSLKTIHAKGVIHRDITPDNIMYTKGGKLKLMDFGSARYYTNGERELSVVLKQGFAPEEQYRKNGKQGPFTDVYALCATIYACITGVVPEDSLDRLANDTLKPPSQMGIQITQAHEAALMHGLALLAENRCQNMDALIEEFQSTANAHSTMDANRLSESYRKQPQPYPQQAYPQNSFNRPQPPVYGQQPYPTVYPQQQPQKSSNTPVIAAIVITVTALLIAGGVLMFILLNNGNNQNDAQTVTAQNTTTEPVPQTEADASTEAPSTQPTTVPPTTKKPMPSIAAPGSKSTSGNGRMSKDAIDNVHDSIGSKFSSDIGYMNKKTNAGNYDYVSTENSRVWIGTAGSFVDDENDKVWYFFDENQKPYFIYRHANGTEYRYYVHNDEVIRYYVGSAKENNQMHYDKGDSAITSTVQKAVDEAYTAYREVYDYIQSN